MMTMMNFMAYSPPLDHCPFWSPCMTFGLTGRRDHKLFETIVFKYAHHRPLVETRMKPLWTIDQKNKILFKIMWLRIDVFKAILQHIHRSAIRYWLIAYSISMVSAKNNACIEFASSLLRKHEVY